MKRKSFTINPHFCLIDKNFKQPKSICVFDSWSIQHYYWQGFSYIILHHLLNVTKLKEAILLGIFITILHILEEYYGNTTKISIEGIAIDYLGPLFNKKINPKKREIDNDYIDNSIGDVLSGVIATILIILYWYYYKRLPYYYLFGVILITLQLLSKAKMLY